ncbi:hypothetical protein [Hyalangium sp.]|uniref:hypothetical protein n=1 Tax=Hyalangium sp. TaxID=2028555 RepID=UPI002D33962E|nr:hypothetical protein [Hyalangium sp.]HYH97801.1 hypothetical protein [Hyalangium sp.]
MDTKKQPKLKLSLKKETLRPLVDQELDMLDSVVGGTCFTSGCCFITGRELEQQAE